MQIYAYKYTEKQINFEITNSKMVWPKVHKRVVSHFYSVFKCLQILWTVHGKCIVGKQYNS
jgi:hypothetical protein